VVENNWVNFGVLYEKTKLLQSTSQLGVTTWLVMLHHLTYERKNKEIKNQNLVNFYNPALFLWQKSQKLILHY